MKRPLIASIAVGLLALPTFAASNQGEKFDFKVSFDRSALDDRAAIVDEYDSIREQVSAKCEAENEGINPLRRVLAVRNCTYVAMEHTIRKIDHQGLAAYHRKVKSS